ncbi:hypothetical protein [Rubellicoccus peritrichatus]|uniref:Uncharacterized protein n=1 Tax=Rubellicoccus peritrichatus TaxID=3080537 RepID=A0AAQ3LFB9_9BACT|nr:hypothetical protein [Puniceicoccus sp. CR14]WOO42688.1 hypothetical protein RZN69_06255 [Puniceicoccus sp. CR14]
MKKRTHTTPSNAHQSSNGNIQAEIHTTSASDSSLGKTSERKGFALIVALGMMGMALLLILSLSTIVQIELSTSSQELYTHKARANALAALNIALGELQQTAGPDQRVTARADLVSTIGGADDSGIQFTTPQNPYYTLVWDVSGSENNSPGDAPGHDFRKEPAVLVSSNEHLDHDLTSVAGYPANYVTETTTLSDNNSVVLVPANTSATSVRAPWVDLDDNSSVDGRYAWWVGDEGIKARINIEDNSGTAAEWRSQTYSSPQASNTELAGLNSITLSQAIDFPVLPLADPTGTLNSPLANQYFHDLSFNSQSLLTDVKHGGFKKDLTYGLNATNTQPVEIEDDAFLFARDLSGADTTNNSNLNFAQWGVLRDFYNLRSPTTGSFAARPHRPNVTSEFQMGVHPVVANYQLGIYADWSRDDIRIHYMPTVVLWNPYSFPLECTDMFVALKQTHGNNQLAIKIEAEGVPLGQRAPDGTVNSVTDNTFNIGAPAVSIPAVTIPPGEAIIFSAPFSLNGYAKAGRSADGSTGPIWGYQTAARNYLIQGYPSGSFIDSDTDITKLTPGGPTPNPRLKLEWSSQEVDLLFAEADNTGDKSFRYQLLSGLASGNNIGNSTATFYTPASDPANAAPELFFVSFMPFADTQFYPSLTTQPMAWTGLFNPRGEIHNDGKTGFPNGTLTQDETSGIGYGDPASYRSGFLAGNAAQSNSLQTPNGQNAYVGTLQTGGATEAILYDLPDARLTSLAQLAHANITAPPGENYGDWSSITRAEGSTATGLSDVGLSWSGANDGHTPSYAIGSSQANPYITNLNNYVAEYNPQLTLSGGSSQGDRYHQYTWDYSYLTNDALYDNYFFSTIFQSGSNFDTDNPLMKIEEGATSTDLLDFEDVAEHLQLQGGFNVNSTSVNAWAAFLASLRDVPFDGNTDAGSLFTRFESAVGDQVNESSLNTTDHDSVSGFRRLDDIQIRNLAENIVEQVKLRGPFPSMSAFVNRVLDPTSLRRTTAELSSAAPDPYDLYSDSSYDLEMMSQLKGALHAALELSTANEGFLSDADFVVEEDEVNGNNFDARKGFASAVGTHVPGYLSQVDILSALGSAMTVRSDTFTIRVAGEALDQLTGNSLGRAYGEAIVQRIADYVSSSDLPTTKTASLNAINQEFGRRFEVVSFRWLSENEL